MELDDGTGDAIYLDLLRTHLPRVLAGWYSPEGVRALLVDKDKAPKWAPPQLRDVTPGMVTALFAPFPKEEELGLYA